MGKTKIEWATDVWNPTRGCSLVSAGCTNCYAMQVAGGVAKAAYQGLTRKSGGRSVWTGEVRLVPEMLDQPLKWKDPRRIFVDSMSDLFHPDVPDEYIRSVFEVMAAADWHTYQLLTKRPDRQAVWTEALRAEAPQSWDMGMRHIWMGTSVEDQAAADERIPHLLRTPAAVRFLSCEPLLGPIDLHAVPWRHGGMAAKGWSGVLPVHDEPDDFVYESQRYALDWVIVGGESGHHARPCNVGWIRDIVRQCRDAGVPVFVKQLGADPCEAIPGKEETRTVNQPFTGGGWSHRRLRDPKGGDPSEWPEDLRVRGFPGDHP